MQLVFLDSRRVLTRVGRPRGTTQTSHAGRHVRLQLVTGAGLEWQAVKYRSRDDDARSRYMSLNSMQLL